MALFGPVGSSQISGSVGIVGATTPTEATVAMPLANAEYSYSFPAGTKGFLMRTESGAFFRFSYTAVGSATGFPVTAGNFLTASDLSITGVTIYFQSTSAAQTAKFISWS